MFQALQVRDFRLLWAAGLVSSVGSWLLTIAVPAHVLMATNSLRDTGLTLTAEYLPVLAVGPFAGVVADRWDRRRLMITANIECAAAVSVMLLGIPAGRYWVLYAALAAESAGSVLYAPAAQALIPAIVGTGRLLNSAGSLSAVTSGVVRLAGGPLGGVLLAFVGIRWLIATDATSYLLSAAAILMTSRRDALTFRHDVAGTPGGVRETAGGRREPGASGVLADLTAAVRAVRADRVTSGLLAVTVVFQAANATLSAVLIPFGIERLGGSEHTGLLLATLGAGFLLGAPVVRVLLDRVQPRRALAASLTATAVAFFLLFSTRSLAAALPAGAAVGMAGSISQAIPQTVVQRMMDNALLGRVGGAFVAAGAAATLLGAVAGPFLAQTVQLPGTAAAASAATLGAAALAAVMIPRVPRSGPARAGSP
jgi:MFS family permease